MENQIHINVFLFYFVFKFRVLGSGFFCLFFEMCEKRAGKFCFLYFGDIRIKRNVVAGLLMWVVVFTTEALRHGGHGAIISAPIVLLMLPRGASLCAASIGNKTMKEIVCSSKFDY